MIQNMCVGKMNNRTCSMKELAKLVANQVATFTGLQWGPLHYRSMERLKTGA